MSFIPHLEKVTRNSTFSHFLLMFGYKIFSFYFPLFLLEKGLSLPKVGFVYLLIYLPIAIASPLVGALSSRINTFILILLGILGYAVYSLGMLLLSPSFFFYILQVILGISASFFFVGNRIILMSSKLKEPARSFGWFYSAPYYAAEFAPVIGAAVIFFLGFNGVFILSILIHAINILFVTISLPKHSYIQVANSYKNSLSHFMQVVKSSFKPNIFPILLFSFAILIVGGFYQSFFLIFLKDIGWDKNLILLYSSLLSVIFLPLSLFAIKILSSSKIIKNILIGGVIFAISSIVVGFTASSVGFIGILILMEIGEFGSFLSNSSRSGFISKIFSSFPHGSASLDTIFSPLGTALGSLIGGFLIGKIGYQNIFIFAGIILLILSLSIVNKKKNIYE